MEVVGCKRYDWTIAGLLRVAAVDTYLIAAILGFEYYLPLRSALLYLSRKQR